VERLGRGPARTRSFEARGADGQVFPSQMQSATRIGTFAAAFRKLGKDPAAGYERLFDLYTKGEIPSISKPSLRAGKLRLP